MVNIDLFNDGLCVRRLPLRNIFSAIMATTTEKDNTTSIFNNK